MSYSIDLRSISVQSYMGILKNQKLLPGRRILLNNLAANFHAISEAGIQNLFELKTSLSTPQKISAFSSKTSIPAEYLVILKREMGSLEQKPVAIADFPGLSGDTLARLAALGIKTSKDFYDYCFSAPNNAVLSEQTDIREVEIKELRSLCNLVRINGVGAVAARTLFESGFTGIAEIAGANAAELLNRMSEVNSARQYYKAALGEKDMQFIIDFGKLIMQTQTGESSA